MISTTRKVRFVRRPDKRRAIRAAPDVPEAAPAGRVPRISRLMALAIHFDRLIREGRVRDQGGPDVVKVRERCCDVGGVNQLCFEFGQAGVDFTHAALAVRPWHGRRIAYLQHLSVPRKACHAVRTNLTTSLPWPLTASG